jgi:hypothetical protein
MLIRRSPHTHTRIISIALMLLLTASSIFGQVGRASLTGIVRDQAGSAIPGVSVTAVHTGTGVSYKTTANEEGAYTLNALPVGAYRISFQVQGFKEVIREGVNLQFRVEMLNLFNRHYFDEPDLDLNSPSFGSITRASGNRTGQFGMRISF